MPGRLTGQQEDTGGRQGQLSDRCCRRRWHLNTAGWHCSRAGDIHNHMNLISWTVDKQAVGCVHCTVGSTYTVRHTVHKYLGMYAMRRTPCTTCGVAQAPSQVYQASFCCCCWPGVVWNFGRVVDLAVVDQRLGKGGGGGGLPREGVYLGAWKSWDLGRYLGSPS